MPHTMSGLNMPQTMSGLNMPHTMSGLNMPQTHCLTGYKELAMRHIATIQNGHIISIGRLVLPNGFFPGHETVEPSTILQ